MVDSYWQWPRKGPFVILRLLGYNQTMYRYYVPKRAPLAFWLCDDTVPFQEHSGTGASGGKKTGTSDPTTSIPLVAGAAFSSVFKTASIGQFTCNVFKQGLESRPFALEAWILPIPKTTTGPQQILSHDGQFDGLSIEGKVVRFATEYLVEAPAEVDFDLQEYQLAHVVGIHNNDKNELWVNDVLVASVDITDAQKADSYVATDGFLYCGNTTSTQELAINGVAFYTSISGDQIHQNYLAGIDFIGQYRVVPQYDGLPFSLDAATGAVFLRNSWVDSSDFSLGIKNNVEYSPDQINPSYSSGLSVAGTWTVGTPLDAQADTSIYGVMVAWSGKDITVDVSLDGTTWTPAISGELVSIISNGYNPTGKDLQIRVSFAGGLAVDPAYLESLTVIGFRNNSVNSLANRTVTVSHPAVMREDYEPNLYRDDNGVNLHNGTLTIGTDTGPDADVARTLELWIKPISGAPTISVGGTKYRNGVADATLPIGEWSLIHYVAGVDITSDITVTGNCIVGQAALYPTPLSSTDVSNIYKSYTGAQTIRFTETVDVEITEGATPAAIYTHDWAIDGAG